MEDLLVKVSYEHYDLVARKAKKAKSKQDKSPYHHIRQSFKTSYYYERKYDFNMALNNYDATYSYVRDMPKTYRKLDEIKAIADLLNFKICYLAFQMNQPNEAFTSFHKHVDYFRNIQGDAKKEFVHYAWMARQYKVFGELVDYFSDHFKNHTINTDQGLYFSIAATLEMNRRESANKICTPLKSTTESIIGRVQPYTPSLIDLNEQTWVGEQLEEYTFENENDPLQNKPIRVDSYTMLIAQELKVDYGNQILDLLNRASAHLKNQPNRKRLFGRTLQQMASEYEHLKFYDVAKKHYDETIEIFKKENWYSILAHLLNHSISCASHLNNIPEKIRYQLMILDPMVPLPSDQRTAIMNDFLLLLDNYHLEEPVVVELIDKDSLITYKLEYQNPNYRVGQSIQLTITMKSNFVNPITFKSLELLFSDPSYHLSVENNENSLYFLPGETKKLNVSVLAGKECILSCRQISTSLGEDAPKIFIRRNLTDTAPFGKETATPTITIKEHDPMLDMDVHFQECALLGEKLPIAISLLNKGDPIINGQFVITTPKSQNLQYLEHQSGSVEIDASSYTIPLSLSETETISETIFFVPKTLDSVFYNLRFEFSTKNYISHVSQHIDIKVLKPLDLNIEFVADFKRMNIAKEKIYENGTFMVLAHITAQADIELVGASLTPAESSFSLESSSHKSNAILLQKDTQYSIIWKLKALATHEESVGDLYIEWRRAGQDAMIFKSHFRLPPIEVHADKQEYNITYSCPKQGSLGKIIQHKILISNLTTAVQEYTLDVSENDNFSVIGNLHHQFKVNPSSTYEVTHKLYPLQLGRISTPAFSISKTRQGSPLLLKSVLQHVFIVP